MKNDWWWAPDLTFIVCLPGLYLNIDYVNNHIILINYCEGGLQKRFVGNITIITIEKGWNLVQVNLTNTIYRGGASLFSTAAYPVMLKSSINSFERTSEIWNSTNLPSKDAVRYIYVGIYICIWVYTKIYEKKTIDVSFCNTCKQNCL